MVKNCKVIVNNEAVTVFDNDGIYVQVPSIKRFAKTVKVIFENHKYIVVDDNFIEPAVKTAKKADKKTTLKEKRKENNDAINKSV